MLCSILAAMSAKDKPSRPAPAGGDSQKKQRRSALNDTGLHVLKGACVKVLGAKANLTTSVEFESPTKAILKIEYDDNISEEQRQAIQDECNQLIAADVPIQQFTLPRAAAEAKYSANPVNHTYIYDKFPVPEKIKDLTIIEIKDWNVNCCPSEHAKRTGELLGLFIQKTKRRAKENAVEIQFIVGQPAVDTLTGKKGGAGGGQKLQKVKAEKAEKDAKAKPEKKDPTIAGGPPTPAQVAAAAPAGAPAAPKASSFEEKSAVSELFGGWGGPGSKSVLASSIDELVDDASGILESLGVDAATIAAFQQQYSVRVETVLGNVQNQAYTQGFTSNSFDPPKFFP
jgi:hypothetical protein